jgi:hypothetical protein
MTSRPLAAGAALLLLGCQHPEDYRWRGTPEFSPDAQPPAPSAFKEWSKPSVAVYSYPTAPAAAPPSVALQSLSDRGQQAAIEALAKAGKKVADVRSAISTPLSSPSAPGEGAAAIEGRYDRTLVASVTKGLSARPGDRLVWTWIDIRPKNFTFTGYTVIATDNETLNIEQIQHQTNASLTGSASQTAGGGTTTSQTLNGTTAGTSASLASALGLTGTLSSQDQTSAAVNQQYMKLGADIVPNELRIYRESERNLDAAGNTLISLSVQVDPTTWHDGARPADVQRVSKLAMTDKGSLLGPKKITLETVVEKAPPHCALIADVTLIYLYRHVTGHEERYLEGEQNVYMEQSSTVAQNVRIVQPDEVRKPSWRIYGADAKTSIEATDVFGRILPLDFSDYEQARNFAQWMNVNKAWLPRRGAKRLGSAGVSLTSGGSDVDFPQGDYFARRVSDADIDQQCAGMDRRDAESAGP